MWISCARNRVLRIVGAVDKAVDKFVDKPSFIKHVCFAHSCDGAILDIGRQGRGC